MEKQKKVAVRQVKTLKNVFDQMHKIHMKELRHMTKKIDNSTPRISTSKLFSQAKYKNLQNQIEWRLKKNLNLIKYLNATARSKGKIESSNPASKDRNSKLPFRIAEQNRYQIENKIFSQTLREVKPSPISSKTNTVTDWELILRPTCIKGSKFPIVISMLLTPEIDPFLKDPPSYDEYKRNPKIHLKFHLENLGEIGKVQIMLNCEQNPEFVKQLLDSWSSSCQYRKVNKIVQGLLIEVEGEEAASKFHPKSNEMGKHFHAGTMSMLLNDDSSIGSKFSITLKDTSILDGQQVVVGRVVKGLEVLASLDQYGSRFGLPRKTVFVENCGIFK